MIKPARQGKLKVLMVVEAADMGVGRHVLDLSEGLLARGHEVHVAYSHYRLGATFQRRLRKIDGLVAVNVPMRWQVHPADIASVVRLRRYMGDAGPFDIVHGHSSKGGAIARLAALGQASRTVYTPNAIRTMSPVIRKSSRVAFSGVERFLAGITDAIVAVSSQELAHLEQVGVKPAIARVIPNGIEPSPLPSRERARKELGLPADALVLGFVGRLTAQKAPEVLIESFASVAASRPRVHLAMVGEGELQYDLQRRTEELGLRGRIHWLGPRPGLFSMPAFDVFVLPSRYEGLPYVLLEALSAHLPIVTTSTSGADDLVESGVNGFVISPEDPRELAAAIGRLVDDPELRGRFATEADGRAFRFPCSRMVEDTERLYLELLLPGRARRGFGVATDPMPAPFARAAPARPSRSALGRA